MSNKKHNKNNRAKNTNINSSRLNTEKKERSFERRTNDSSKGTNRTNHYNTNEGKKYYNKGINEDVKKEDVKEEVNKYDLDEKYLYYPFGSRNTLIAAAMLSISLIVSSIIWVSRPLTPYNEKTIEEVTVKANKEIDEEEKKKALNDLPPTSVVNNYNINISTNNVNLSTSSDNEVKIEKEEKAEEEVSFNKTGYLIEASDVYDDANFNSNVVKTVEWNDEIKFTDSIQHVSMNGWVRTEDGYIPAYSVVDEEIDSTEYNVTGCDRRKSYMDYRKITSKPSKQYKLQLLSSTDSSTGIRVINGRYEIALGSGYRCKIGQYVDLELADGTVLECVVGEAKRDCDTNKWHTVGKDGGVAEFIVYTPHLSKEVKKHGDVSHTNDDFKTNVNKVIKYDYCLL